MILSSDSPRLDEDAAARLPECYGRAKKLFATVRYGSSSPVSSEPWPDAHVRHSKPSTSAVLEKESRSPEQVVRSGPPSLGRVSNATRSASSFSGAPRPFDVNAARPSSQPPSSNQTSPSASTANPLPQSPRDLSQRRIGCSRSSR